MPPHSVRYIGVFRADVLKVTITLEENQFLRMMSGDSSTFWSAISLNVNDSHLAETKQHAWKCQVLFSVSLIVFL